MADSTTALDLSRLPPPMVVEQLSYEAIRAAIVDQLVAELPAFDATVTSDPAVKVLEVVAYREMLIRQQFNERARQVMLAYATGSNLDQLGALLDVGRLAGEADGLSRAHPAGARGVLGGRACQCLSVLCAFCRAHDCRCQRRRAPARRYPRGGHGVSGRARGRGRTGRGDGGRARCDGLAGTVIISLLSSLGDGSASAAEIEAVEMAVAEDEDVRPLTDWPKVVSASIVPYEIDIDLTIYTGPDETVVLAAAQQAVEAYRAGARKLGRSITRAGLFGAAMVSGVHNAVINQPPADVPITRQQVACLGVAVRIAGHVD
jgi:phage-related baseplate assembly protein